MKELIEKLEKLKDLIQIENEVDVDSSIEVLTEAIQALQQSQPLITLEEIEYRIKEEFKKHKELDWAKIAASKIYAVIGQQREWISVEDRLPENNIGVLVFIPIEDNHITSGMYDYDNKWVLLDDYRLIEDNGQVTHWMPLPTPPNK